MLNEDKIKETFTQSSAKQTSLAKSNIPQSNKNVKSDISTKYSIQEYEQIIIKAFQEEMKNYESKGEIDNPYIDGSEDRQGSDNLYNAKIEWERELLRKIDEYNRKYGEDRHNRRKVNE